MIALQYHCQLSVLYISLMKSNKTWKTSLAVESIMVDLFNKVELIYYIDP